MNTQNLLDKIRTALAVGTSLVKLGIGATQVVLCAAAALLALGVAGLEDRSLIVAGYGVHLWPPAIFCVFSALQLCCAVQGAGIASRVLDRAFEAVISRFARPTFAVQVQSSTHDMGRQSSARIESELNGLSDSQPVQSAGQSPEEPCR